MTQEQLTKHTAKQNDIKQFIQVLTPLTGINSGVDPEVQKLACNKLKELIPDIKAGIPGSVIKTLL